MSLHDIIYARAGHGSLWDYALSRKLLGGGSETVIGTDYTPYLYRTAPSFGASYNRQRPVVVGGSLGWNQLVDVGATSVTVQSGHKYYSNINGVKTIGSSNGSAIAINDDSADNVIDLTALFGTTVADAIYAMEQSTAGAGVAYFKTLFGEDYYSYDSGSLQSVQTSAHVIRDGNDTVIGNYPLDNIVLRGVPKWENGQLKYDGDVYHADGTVDRKYGIVDLGSLTWANNQSGTNAYEAYADLTTVKPSTTNIMCNVAVRQPFSDVADYGIRAGSDFVAVKVPKAVASSGPALKQWLTDNNAFAVYELATPTTESATPYTALQMADPQGTEEWVTSGVVPVGQETEYISKS